MTTQSTEEILNKLRQPFSQNDIEWKVQTSNKGNNGAYAFVVAYVNNRAIQNRLDEVFGIGGWKNSYVEFSGGIICELSCYINGQWITKSDGSEPSNFEAFKGGLSNAMKRAAVQFGIGRYLYKLEPIYVQVSETKSNNSIYLNDKKNKVVGYYEPPCLPDWALPPDEQKQGKNNETTSTSDNNNKKREIDKKTGNNTFNRNSYFISITEFINIIKLKPRAAMELFHHINSDTKSDCVEIKDIKEKATDKELIKYYETLKPVSDLVKMSIHYKIPVENVLNYVRILKPQERIDNLHSCLLRLNREDIKEINGFIEGDIKNNMFEHQTA